MGLKKISELELASSLTDDDYVPYVDATNGTTKRVKVSDLLNTIVGRNSGAHNSIYRGKDITDLFYDGTLSKQIAAGTFDDIFIGDYITGKTSNRKYLVADINYYKNMGDTECTTNHLVMIPERLLYKTRMNSSNVTTGAYVGSEMYTSNLASAKTTISNDFDSSHILTHRVHLQNAVTNGYESGGTWFDSTVEIMSEKMVYGCQIFGNSMNGTNVPNLYSVDNSQLSIFRLDHSKLIARDDAGNRWWWWLRDVVSASSFASVGNGGGCIYRSASNSDGGVRPAFLIK